MQQRISVCVVDNPDPMRKEDRAKQHVHNPQCYQPEKALHLPWGEKSAECLEKIPFLRNPE